MAVVGFSLRSVRKRKINFTQRMTNNNCPDLWLSPKSLDRYCILTIKDTRAKIKVNPHQRKELFGNIRPHKHHISGPRDQKLSLCKQKLCLLCSTSHVLITSKLFGYFCRIPKVQKTKMLEFTSLSDKGFTKVSWTIHSCLGRSMMLCFSVFQ